MPITNTQDEWKTVVIDVRHINPSMLEGGNLNTSALGKGAAVPIDRYPPVYITPASISGGTVIPSLLTCNPGVVSGSPQPDFEFQWKENGADIVGEISSTYLTDVPDDGKTITCYVRAFSNQGEAFSTSNGIVVQVVNPIEVGGFSLLTVTGLNLQKKISLNTMLYMTVAGMGSVDYSTLYGETVSVVSGLNVEPQESIFEFSEYAVQMNVLLEALPIINPNGADGITGWTVTEGILSTKTSTYTPSPTGFAFWGPGADLTKANQVVAVDPGSEAAIDTGEVRLCVSWLQSSINNNDLGRVRFELLNAADAVLKTITASYVNINYNRWELLGSNDESVPALTRKVKIHQEQDRILGTDGDAYITAINALFYKPVNL